MKSSHLLAAKCSPLFYLYFYFMLFEFSALLYINPAVCKVLDRRNTRAKQFKCSAALRCRLLAGERCTGKFAQIEGSHDGE